MTDTKLFDPNRAEQLSIRYYDAYAASGDWRHAYLEEPVGYLEEFFNFLTGPRVLDVGCGWARYAYRFADQDLDYTGIDHSAGLIKIARETCPGQRFEVMSYREMSFPDDSFDGLWCCCVFNAEPKHNMQKVLAGLKRILIPDGTMTVIMPAGDGSYEELMGVDEGRPFYLASYEFDEFAELLETTGFTILDSHISPWQGAMSFLLRN